MTLISYYLWYLSFKF